MQKNGQSYTQVNEAMKRIEDCQKNGGNLEEVREVGIVAAAGGLEISEILQISRDFEHIVHHLKNLLLLLILVVLGIEKE